MILHHFLQLGGEALRMKQVIDAQAAAGHLVLVGRADALPVVPIFWSPALAALAGTVERRVVRQDQRASRADLEARTDIKTAGFEFLDLEIR